jgi:hypothetical protein
MILWETFPGALKNGTFARYRVNRGDMSSEKRVVSSRRNGALSRGPRTPGGKRRSAHNAIRHGLLARCVVLENESEEAFRTVLEEHLACFDVREGVPFGMVEEMVSAYWRLRRLWAVETRLFDDAMAAQSATGHPDDERARIAAAFSTLAESPQLALLNRYEARLHRMYQRAFHNVFTLREMKLPNEPRSPDPGPAAAGVPAPVALPSRAVAPPSTPEVPAAATHPETDSSREPPLPLDSRPAAGNTSPVPVSHPHSGPVPAAPALRRMRLWPRDEGTDTSAAAARKTGSDLESLLL